MHFPFSIPGSLWLATMVAYLFEAMEITVWVLWLGGVALAISLAAMLWPRRKPVPVEPPPQDDTLTGSQEPRL